MTDGKALRRIGFIGVGNQGGPMAMRLIESGRPVSVWARRPEALEPYIAAGATAAADPQSLGAACDFVGVCVLDDAATLAVCEPVIAGLGPGGVLAIHSTVHPETCRRLAALAARRQVAAIDAPVSGGAAAAREGRLAVMIGGDPEVVAACEPIIRAYATVVLRLGDVGAGQTAKLINNTLMAANLRLAHDAVELGKTLGLDPAALETVISAGSGGSFAMNAYAKLPSLAAFAQGARLLRKDVGLLAEVAAAARAPDAALLPTARDFLDLVERAVAG